MIPNLWNLRLISVVPDYQIWKCVTWLIIYGGITKFYKNINESFRYRNPASHRRDSELVSRSQTLSRRALLIRDDKRPREKGLEQFTGTTGNWYIPPTWGWVLIVDTWQLVSISYYNNIMSGICGISLQTIVFKNLNGPHSILQDHSLLYVWLTIFCTTCRVAIPFSRHFLQLSPDHIYWLSIPPSNINPYQYSFFVSTPFLWNTVPILQLSNRIAFWSALHRFLLP